NRIDVRRAMLATCEQRAIGLAGKRGAGGRDECFSLQRFPLHGTAAAGLFPVVHHVLRVVAEEKSAVALFSCSQLRFQLAASRMDRGVGVILAVGLVSRGEDGLE